MKPLVSVIIPTYKRSDLLPKAINSVLSQSYKNIEVVVVDDNDPESEYRQITEKKMACFFEDNRVKYVKHSKNRNGAAARNTGLQNCSGDYVCFLDDDDVFFQNKCEKQVDVLEKKKEYNACCCDYKKNGEMIYLTPKDDYTEDILLLNKTPQTSGIMFRRGSVDKIGGFDESYIRHQDYELLLRFFHSDNKICKINEPLYERFSSEISNTPKGDSFLQVKKKFLSDFEEIISEYDLRQKGFKNKVYSVHYERVAKNYLKNHCFRMFFLYSVKSLCMNPGMFAHTILCEIVFYIRILLRKLFIC